MEAADDTDSSASAYHEFEEQRAEDRFDEQEQRAFYYNKNTVEIRWRKPQILLDQMDKPMCNNCDYYEVCVRILWG